VVCRRRSGGNQNGVAANDCCNKVANASIWSNVIDRDVGR
jgi:hypothetical protein